MDNNALLLFFHEHICVGPDLTYLSYNNQTFHLTMRTSLTNIMCDYGGIYLTLPDTHILNLIMLILIYFATIFLKIGTQKRGCIRIVSRTNIIWTGLCVTAWILNHEHN